jgi:hypothetical protein
MPQTRHYAERRGRGPGGGVRPRQMGHVRLFTHTWSKAEVRLGRRSALVGRSVLLKSAQRRVVNKSKEMWRLKIQSFFPKRVSNNVHSLPESTSSSRNLVARPVPLFFRLGFVVVPFCVGLVRFFFCTPGRLPRCFGPAVAAMPTAPLLDRALLPAPSHFYHRCSSTGTIKHRSTTGNAGHGQVQLRKKAIRRFLRRVPGTAAAEPSDWELGKNSRVSPGVACLIPSTALLKATPSRTSPYN